MDYAAQTVQPQPAHEMPPYMQADNAPQAGSPENWSTAQPQAIDPVDVLASNQHPLTQPAAQTEPAAEMVSSEAVNSFYAEPAAPQMMETLPQAAPQEIAPEVHRADSSSIGDKVSALLADIQALESENAQLKAQLSDIEALRAKELLLKDSAEKLQSIVDAMRG